MFSCAKTLAEENKKAKNYELEFKKPETNIKAPHFVMYVKKLLADKYGQRTLEQAGLKIYTTLDWYKQKRAEKIVKKRAEKNKNNYGARNASLVSIDPKTGQILTMVGSKDYFSQELDGQVNIATSQRQPGSSLKPMAYATAFEQGYKPSTMLYDTETDFAPGEGKYKPQNFDGETRGPVSMKKALAGSLNIPAVKSLYLAGKEEVMENLKDYFFAQRKPEEFYDFDGYRLEYNDWWFNVRPSNTEPYLRLVVEAKNQTILDEKLAEIKEVMAVE